MTIEFFGLGGRFLGLSGLGYYFFQKTTSEMDSAYQKTYNSIPHITKNDNWFFGLGGRFSGLGGLKYHFFLKITSEMDSAYPKTYISTPYMTENYIWFFWPPWPLKWPRRPRIRKNLKIGVDNWYVKLHTKFQVSSFIQLGLAPRSRFSPKKCQGSPPPLYTS